MNRRRLLAYALTLATLPLNFVRASDTERAEFYDVATRVEGYLNSIETLSAQFLQVDSNGNPTKGRFYLRRPGQLRFEYDDPSPLLIIADGFWFILHDKALGQVNRYPLYKTPLGVLVDEPVSFKKKVKLINAEKGLGVLRIMLVDRANPDDGWISITFTEPPLSLRKWKIKDTQGGTTEVSLTDVKINQKLDPNLFFFEDPRVFME